MLPILKKSFPFLSSGKVAKSWIRLIFQTELYSCDKDNLDQVLRKIISKEKVELKNQALFVSMKLLRGDLKQVSIFSTMNKLATLYVTIF